jgi:hypothetical protein
VSDESELTPKDHWWAKVFEHHRALVAEAARRAAHPPPRLVASAALTEPSSQQAQAKFDQRFRVIEGCRGHVKGNDAQDI